MTTFMVKLNNMNKLELFAKKVKALLKVFEDIGNPFPTHKLLQIYWMVQ